ncbi:hypothetical protein [Cytobacillus oceanisediminis]|uniref:hypothetical protein n=1 Tax=Cytobacillus oceanisediminis TaxID=665099 RepID=UPI0020792BE4|nr:hypothetical protein [Cytobacillus oceanisediminis]USK42237.1 hypothetical protein LIT27_16495 [Cytobacillus oceanisediminis]
MNSYIINHMVKTTDYHNREFSLENLLQSYNEKVENKISQIPKIWLPLARDFLFDDEKSFWNKEISDTVFHKLNAILQNCEDQDRFYQRFYDSLEHFFIALSAFNEITNTIKLYKEYHVPEPLKLRMYYLPTYNSIVEGCMTNLFKFIRDNLDLIDSKNLLEQTKLNGLVEALNSRGLGILTGDIDVDLRNAINHGGVYATDEKEVTFFYSKGKKGTKSKHMQDYDIKRKIVKLVDTTSSIFLGVIRFFIEHKMDFNSLEKYASEEKQMVYESLVKLELSTYNKKCLFLSSSTNIKQEEQINISFYTDDISRNEKFEFSIWTFLKLYYYFPESKRFHLSFSSERTLPSFIDINTNDIKRFHRGEIRTLEELVQVVIKNNTIMLWEPYTEEIDKKEAKKAYYQDIIYEKYEIRNITDISTENRKRFKCELYIKDATRRNHVKQVIRQAVEEIKNLQNYPNLKHKIKFGDISADLVNITVYKNRARDGKRERYLISNNENFIATVQYYVHPKYKINDSLKDGIWKDLKFRKEEDIEYGWNPNF